VYITYTALVCRCASLSRRNSAQVESLSLFLSLSLSLRLSVRLSRSAFLTVLGPRAFPLHANRYSSASTHALASTGNVETHVRKENRQRPYAAIARLRNRTRLRQRWTTRRCRRRRRRRRRRSCDGRKARQLYAYNRTWRCRPMARATKTATSFPRSPAPDFRLLWSAAERVTALAAGKRATRGRPRPNAAENDRALAHEGLRSRLHAPHRVSSKLFRQNRRNSSKSTLESYCQSWNRRTIKR